MTTRPATAKSLATGKAHRIKSCDTCHADIAFVQAASGRWYPAEVVPAQHGEDYVGPTQYRVRDWEPHRCEDHRPDDVDLDNEIVRESIRDFRQLEDAINDALARDEWERADRLDVQQRNLRRAFGREFGVSPARLRELAIDIGTRAIL